MPAHLLVTAWRDRDDAVTAAVPGLALGAVEVTGPATGAAERLAAAGARRVRLAAPVDARGPGAVPALLLVRELTRLGVAVDWDLILDPAGPDWRPLSHLHPPCTLSGGTDATAGLAQWREGFFPGRFVVRKGPGFMQVRDWRWGWLQVTTLTDVAQIELVTALLEDPITASVPLPAAAGHLLDLGLIQRIADQLWLPAYRVRRWPVPAYLV